MGPLSADLQPHVPLCSHVLLLHLSFYLSINVHKFLLLLFFVVQRHTCAHAGRLHSGNYYRAKQAGSRLRQVSTQQRKTCPGDPDLVIKSETLVLLVILKLIVVGFRLMAIQQCELVLVHIYPQGEDTLVSDRPKKEVGEKLDSQRLIKINHNRK